MREEFESYYSSLVPVRSWCWKESWGTSAQLQAGTGLLTASEMPLWERRSVAFWMKGKYLLGALSSFLRNTVKQSITTYSFSVLMVLFLFFKSKKCIFIAASKPDGHLRDHLIIFLPFPNQSTWNNDVHILSPWVTSKWLPFLPCGSTRGTGEQDSMSLLGDGYLTPKWTSTSTSCILPSFFRMTSLPLCFQMMVGGSELTTSHTITASSPSLNSWGVGAFLNMSFSESNGRNKLLQLFQHTSSCVPNSTQLHLEKKQWNPRGLVLWKPACPREEDTAALDSTHCTATSEPHLTWEQQPSSHSVCHPWKLPSTLPPPTHLWCTRIFSFCLLLSYPSEEFKQ